MKKKRMKRDKKPVLTSPWKIGTLVSLLLVFMSIGVACYLVTLYGIKLAWLKTGSGGWSIDSSLFFKDAYPLMAGVMVMSTLAYFVVTSAVRRYRFYLDSGQDYRTMISLAESIDDLTNPAQIARLSSYPELQAVLRNYGDQIREISQDVSEKQEAVLGYDELERDIDGLLGGAGPDLETVAGREYASVYGKVYDRVEADRARLEEIGRRGESDRRQCARAALACGRAMEAISGAGEDLLAITNAASELAETATQPGRAGASKRESGGAPEKVFTGIVNDMESSIRKLQDGGHVLHEFSEENNGIAINLALMAARGNVDEHDLATFAERVRSTAERFHKLSGTISSIAQGLLATCCALKERPCDAPASGVPDAAASRAAAETARRIEERCGSLQKLICNLGSELQDVHETVQKDQAMGVPGDAPTAPPARDEAENLDGGAPRERRIEEPAADSSEFVIDHGSSWGGIEEEPESTKTDTDEEPPALAALRREKPAAPESTEEPEQDSKGDFVNMSSLRQLDHREEPEEARAAEASDTRTGESWMEMPGHRWLKIDVEKGEQEEDPGRVDVTVEAPAAHETAAAAHEAPAAAQREPRRAAAREEAPETAREPRRAAQEPAGDTRHERRRSAAPEPAPAAEPAASPRHDVLQSAEEPPFSSAAGEDDDPVYDLLELGAVEYVEETQARR